MEPVAKGRPRFRRAAGFVQTYTDAKTKAAEKEILLQAMKHKSAKPLTKKKTYRDIGVELFRCRRCDVFFVKNIEKKDDEKGD